MDGYKWRQGGSESRTKAFRLVRSAILGLSDSMLVQSALLLLCFLWVMLCMRFYLLISKDNTMQRRLLAMAAGLGAGLIYVLGNMIITLLKAPSPSDVCMVLDKSIMSR
ncbi:MAG: hypothetical protein V4599_14695, partial [Verrucomicrobiota bacterium]